MRVHLMILYAENDCIIVDFNSSNHPDLENIFWTLKIFGLVPPILK